jgi:hypothetical protein
VIACGGDCIKIKTDFYDENQLLHQQHKNLTRIVNDLKAEQLSEETFCNEFIATFQEFRQLVMKLTSGICVPELNKMADVMDEMIARKLSANSMKTLSGSMKPASE